MNKVPIEVLISDLKTNEDFIYGNEPDKWLLNTAIGYAIDIFGNVNLEDFPNGNNFTLEDACCIKGDGKDEETTYGIFSRKSDGKLFEVYVHDAGFIGLSTLTMCEYLEDDRSKWQGKYKNIK